MPLKHFTETMLVIALGAVTIVTGVVLSTLPGLPQGFFPWAGIFVATVLYPAFLYPLLKKNRADYSFRALHFAPVSMALGWMFIEILTLKVPQFDVVHRIYTWGWSTVGVATAFLLLAIFCLQVIRRRVPRLFFLTLLFVPFIASAVVSERVTHWDTSLAALLWRKPVEIASNTASSSISSYLSPSSKGEKVLTSSSVTAEEEWRKKLRDLEQGKVHSVQSSSFSAKGPLAGVSAASELSTGSGTTGKKYVARKKHLTDAGGEMESIVLFAVAAYAAVVHQRARRRLV